MRRRPRGACTKLFSCRRSAAAARSRKSRTDVVLLGFGRVGRELADQIAAPNGNQPSVRVVGLLDRSGYIFEPRGISRRRLLDLTKRKDAGELLSSLGGKTATAAEALTTMAEHAVSRPIIVDVTSEETGDLLRTAIGHGFNVVLANKKPLAESWDRYAALLATSANGGPHVKYEATVGAGLPIIDTYHKLVETGDRILRIEGCVSGTLTYIMSAISEGQRFSDAVRKAVEKGYAEPDAREDLSGADAARKGLILGRLLGYRGPAPTPHDLVPRALKKVSLDEFFKRLPDFDQEWADRVARERENGRVLRYVVTATPRSILGEARVGSRIEPDGRARRDPEPDRLHDPALQRAAGGQRPRRRRRGHGRGHSERHLFAGRTRLEQVRSQKEKVKKPF